MIDIKSISNMTEEEIEEDLELRQELLNELKNKDIKSYIDFNKAKTVFLFDIYKMAVNIENKYFLNKKR